MSFYDPQSEGTDFRIFRSGNIAYLTRGEIGYYILETVNNANSYIYDINGFQEKNISISERGKGATTLQGSALRAGIYFYTLICDGKPVDTKQMILTR